jgi:hypothetical protein
MAVEDVLNKAYAYCEEGKVKVFALTENGPCEVQNPLSKLEYLFSEDLVYRWLGQESRWDEVRDAEVENYKHPLTIQVSDFDPLLSGLESGTRLGIQIANISYSKLADRIYYKRRSDSAKELIESGQQVSEEDRRIYDAFTQGTDSGIRPLNSALRYCRDVTFLYNMGLLLANASYKRGIDPVLGICIDNLILGKSESRLQKIGITEQDITKDTLARFLSHKQLLDQQVGISLPVTIFLQCGLAGNPLPGFGGYQSCPTRAASAIGEFVKKDCDAVVNFYVEDDMSQMKATPHYERIERGMLLRTEQNDPVLRSNIYLGDDRTFMTIHGAN